MYRILINCVRVKNTKSYSRIPTDVYNIDVNTLLSSDARYLHHEGFLYR